MKRIQLLAIISSILISSNPLAAELIDLSRSHTATFIEKPEINTIYNLSAISFIDEEENETKDWWLLYADQNLNNLIEKVSKNNLDHKIALNRLEASHFIARASLGKEFPIISIGSQYSGQKNPKNLTTPSAARLTTPGPRVFAPGEWVNIYSLPLNLSYEPDFFLKNRLKTKSKQLQAEAAHYEAELTKLNIIYKATELYFNLSNIKKQLEIQDNILSLTKKNLLLSQALNKSGLKNQLFVNTAKEDLLSQEIKYRNLLNTEEILLSDLSFLMGEKPYVENLLSDLDLIKEPALNTANLSSELLYNRPDIKMSEKLLAASDIDVKIARKSYLPSFSLALQNGLNSVDISNLVSPESLLVAVVAGMTQTLFTAGTREAELNYVKAKNKELLNSHSKTILNALKEAELSLKTLNKTEQILLLSQEKENLVQEKLKFNTDKYKQGLISELDLNSSDLEFLEIESAKLNAKTQKLISFSSLSKALGGKLNVAE